ncbi:MAG: membrane protein insertion efficiency factor YidD [Firmicutes bacterium]|nr:membrane protein insertion efficiency factor YidD [Bacillota bacterium]
MLKKLVTLPIRFYQKFLSPLKSRPTCRFYPTCSQYALDAINEWGVIRGLALAFWRVLRCNPFNPGGIDYVPKRRNRKNQS